MPLDASGDAYHAKAMLHRELAERTSDSAMRRVHERMARLYELLAAPGGRERRRDSPGGEESGRS